jgi:signal transduction histidine kinase
VTAIVAVAAGAVLLFAVPLALILPGIYRDEELVRLQRDTVAATRGIDLSGGRDTVELPVSPDALAVYATDGTRVVGRGPAAADGVVGDVLRSGRPADAHAAGRLLVAVPLVSGERVTGAVRAQRSDAAVARRARHGWLLIAAAATLLIALAGAAAVLVGRSLARPLERLSGAALRLGEGDFTARAPASGVAEVDAVGGALAGTAARLQALLARERAFSANASHQLRTPLAALRLALESMELRLEATPELDEALTEVDRLEATIQLLLDVARDAPRTPVTSDLRTLLDAAERRWRGPLAAEGRPLHSELRVAEVEARATPAAVGELLDVLVENALRHGEGAVTLVVREASTGWLALDISDEGTGFAEPSRALTRGVGTGDGHGIGLALAVALAEAEGGRLLLARSGPRPVVTVLLPRVE